jgi:recombination protein RecT
MANETTATKKQDDPVVSIIRVGKPNLAARLPKGIDPDRFILGILTAIQKSKANAQPGKSLADCDPNSVLLAAYDAAEIGCSLSPALQLGWIIPYGKEAQFQPSYRFFIQKAYETKEVKTFYAEVVYAGDKIERQFAPKRNLFHAIGDGERSKNTAIGAYAFIQFNDDTVDWEYMTAEQIGRHQKHSKQPNSLMWTTFWEEAWRKTTVRVLAKRLPLKNRDLEGLVEMVNRDAERDLTIDIDKIVEPSIPRRMSETEKPAEKTAAAESNQPVDEKPKEDQGKTAEAAAAPASAAGAPAAGSMFDDDKDPYATPAAISEFWDKVFAANWKKNDVMEFLKKTFDVTAVKDLRVSQLNSAAEAMVKEKKK